MIMSIDTILHFILYLLLLYCMYLHDMIESVIRQCIFIIDLPLVVCDFGISSGFSRVTRPSNSD